jgi:hypothetical protein
MTQPQSLSLPSVYEGTTWEGIGSVTLQRPAGTPLPLEGAHLKMIYRRAGERRVRLSLSTGAGIQITDPAAGVFQVPARILDLPAGTYYWEIIVTFSSGEVVPLFVGTQEITRIGSAS